MSYIYIVLASATQIYDLDPTLGSFCYYPFDCHVPAMHSVSSKHTVNNQPTLLHMKTHKNVGHSFLK